MSYFKLWTYEILLKLLDQRWDILNKEKMNMKLHILENNVTTIKFDSKYD